MTDVFVTGAWSNRDEIRRIAGLLRNEGLTVFDWTDDANRKTPPFPPEHFDEPYDPETCTESYYSFLGEGACANGAAYAMFDEILALDISRVILLVLPSDETSTAHWAYGVGARKRTVICGRPGRGAQLPVHLWASQIVAGGEFGERIDKAVVTIVRYAVEKQRKEEKSDV